MDTNELLIKIWKKILKNYQKVLCVVWGHKNHKKRVKNYNLIGLSHQLWILFWKKFKKFL